MTFLKIIGFVVLIVGLLCIPPFVLQWILSSLGYDLSFWLCAAICWFVSFIGRCFHKTS